MMIIMATTLNNLKPALPPKTTWKPGKVKVVRALFKYVAQHGDELSFEEGDLLYVYDQHSDPNWWRAKCGNREGLVPYNYVEEQTEEMELPLHDAARRGNLSFLKECLERGVSGTGLDSVGNTPLYWAARSGHVDCVKELLNLTKTAINAQNLMGETPLHIAASHGHYEVIELLLQSGADASLRNKQNLLAEDLSSDKSVKDLIQRSCKQYYDTHSYAYDDYCDESD